MKQIRNNVFETNSSSTHSIAIPTSKLSEYPSYIEFHFGDFGWSFVYEEPASYLYTAIYEYYRYNNPENIEEKINQIKKVLTEHNIDFVMEEPYENGDYNGYVDHSENLDEFLNAVFENDETLLNFICFGIVITGNDNCNVEESWFLEPYNKMVEGEWNFETHTSEKVENPHYNEEYEKNYTWYTKSN